MTDWSEGIEVHCFIDDLKFIIERDVVQLGVFLRVTAYTDNRSLTHPTLECGDIVQEWDIQPYMTKSMRKDERYSEFT